MDELLAIATYVSLMNNLVTILEIENHIKFEMLEGLPRIHDILIGLQTYSLVEIPLITQREIDGNFKEIEGPLRCNCSSAKHTSTLKKKCVHIP